MEDSTANEQLTIPDLLTRNAARFSNAPANREKEYGIWQSWTWREVERETEALALGFLSLGVEAGDHVAVIGRNRPHLYWSMLAAQLIGAIPVPLYPDAVAAEIAYALDHCGTRYVIAGDQEQVDKVLELKESLPSICHIVYLDPRGMRKYDHSRITDLRDIQRQGLSESERLRSELERRRSRIKSSSVCVMLYTSGTTGKPKGVVLTHRNIVEASRASSEFDSLAQTDSVLAYLPMAWVGDFIFSIGQSYWCGFCVNCPESAETMMMDLKEIGPTYFFAPPRIFESILTSVMIRMEDAGAVKRRMFKYFMDHAGKCGPALLSGKRLSAADRLLYELGDLCVYGPLRNVLGFSRIRVGYTAGEAIGPEIFEFYRSIGINLKQLYGQTEASVFITQQPDGEVYSETVGVPSPGVEIRIDDSGEVYFRSPGTFEEYYKNPESTASAKDAEGWVATGDAGYIETETGHLRIIDRAKDVGKTANGGLFAPKYVENKLKFFSNILEAVVFGNGRPFCAAVVNIDLAAVGNWAERKNISYSSYQELAQNPQVYEMIGANVVAVNESLSADEMLAGCVIKRFVILHKELDADDGELTRTKKVRRSAIEDKYFEIVEAFYCGKDEVYLETEVTYEDGRKGSIAATLKICDVEAPAATLPKAA